MTPLDRARELIALRAKATAGEWFGAVGTYEGVEYIGVVLKDNRKCIVSICGKVQADDFEESCNNAEFIEIAANHVVDVCEALEAVTQERDYWRTIAQEGVGGLPLEGEKMITVESLQSENAAMKQAFAEWESVRTFRNDTNSHEWLALVATMESKS